MSRMRRREEEDDEEEGDEENEDEVDCGHPGYFCHGKLPLGVFWAIQRFEKRGRLGCIAGASWAELG